MKSSLILQSVKHQLASVEGENQKRIVMKEKYTLLLYSSTQNLITQGTLRLTHATMRNRIDPSKVQVLYTASWCPLLYYTYLLNATAVERIPYVQNKSTVASMETKVETERIILYGKIQWKKQSFFMGFDYICSFF